jgi:hypothetical protein
VNGKLVVRGHRHRPPYLTTEQERRTLYTGAIGERDNSGKLKAVEHVSKPDENPAQIRQDLQIGHRDAWMVLKQHKLVGDRLVDAGVSVKVQLRGVKNDHGPVRTSASEIGLTAQQ